MTGYLRIVAAGSRFLAVLAASLLLIACLVVFWSVVVRYAFAASTVWQSEFVKYAIVAATLLGSPYVLMIGGHVGVDLFEGRIGRVRRIIQLALAGVIGLSFCMVLAFGASRYFLEAWSNGWVTESVWAPPLWVVLAPFPVGVGWLCLQYVAELYKLPGAAGREVQE